MRHANHVQLNSDDVIEIVFCGDQTQATVESVSKAGGILAGNLRLRGKPILVLVNLEKCGKSDVAARRAAATALKEPNYDRLAVYGASKVVKRITDIVIRAVNKERKVRIFSSRQAAVGWLFGLPSAAVPKVRLEKEDEYRRYVKQKIRALNDIISLAVIGEYSKDIQIPRDDDEFTDTFVGLRLLVETLEEKAKKVNRLLPDKKSRASSRGWRDWLKKS